MNLNHAKICIFFLKYPAIFGVMAVRWALQDKYLEFFRTKIASSPGSYYDEIDFLWH